VIIERNVLKVDAMVPLFELIRKNHWDYLHQCSGLVYSKLARDFYGFLEVIQDDQSGLILQTIVRGVTFRVDAALIGSIIGTDPVPFVDSPFPDSVVSHSMEELPMFFDPQHRAQDRVSHFFRIGIFSSPHCLLVKIVQHNLWPIARRSELFYKRTRFLYALIQRIPFCLCKHIVLTMLEMRDEHQTSLPFACLVTRICLQVVLDIPTIEPKEKTKDTLGNHTVMKSNAQLRIEDQQEVASPPAQDDPAAPSSSQTAPPPPASDVMLSRILDTMVSEK